MADDAAANYERRVWSYSESTDKMRGTVTEFAMLQSQNSIDFGFPYGDVTETLTLRRRDNVDAVILHLRGQFICNEYSGQTVEAKFDSGPIVPFTCSEPDSNSSGIIFIDNEPQFIRDLRKASIVTIEANYYDRGREQFTFNVAGLKWP